MKAEGTKRLILENALSLFSQKGYEGVSMREIAAASGIRAASIYNYFTSKKALFDSLVDEMSRRYGEAAAAFRIPSGSADELAPGYARLGGEELAAMTQAVFLFFLKDEFASKFRRMLTMEQYRSAETGEAFRRFFIDGVMRAIAQLFGSMIRIGAFSPCDPEVMAIHFYAPVFLLLSRYDSRPEKEEEALEALRRHVAQFAKVYRLRRTGR